MKTFKKFLLLILIIPFAFIFSACSNNDPSVVRIEKTKTIGTTDTYTIFYSDGSKTYFTVENGKVKGISPDRDGRI